MNRIVAAAVVVVLILAAVAYVGATYLVSKLDGTGGTTAPHEEPAAGMLQYASEDGYSFQYPDAYELSSRPGAPGDGDALVLLPKGYTPPLGGEGPPSISVQVFTNHLNLSLEQWIRTDKRSNFALSSDGTLNSFAIDNRPAVSYQHSGLYETDAVAVAHNGKIYLFSAGWIQETDRTRFDLTQVLQSLKFN